MLLTAKLLCLLGSVSPALTTQVLRRLYDVINVLESIDLLERSLTVKRGVQWRGPPLTDVALPPSCPRVEPTRFKDLLRKQAMTSPAMRCPSLRLFLSAAGKSKLIRV